MARISPQNYPRINDTADLYYGYLDDSQLVDHPIKISKDQMNQFIMDSIQNAELKSSREILNVSDGLSESEIEQLYQKEGRKLFSYFHKYPGDPAATAHQLFNEHYEDVAREQFHLRTLQKERMNSGWRYQFLAFECAKRTGRFSSVADIGAAEADFNAVVTFKDEKITPLSLFVSVKNRTNTMGGQDWPKAIRALEQIALSDKNRRGPYLCVFGIAMESGKKCRNIKTDAKTKQAHSVNTEIWLANYFWPFFSNYYYEEIMSLVLEVLLRTKKDDLPSKVVIPASLINSFGKCCTEYGLIDENGRFNNPYKLVDFFVK